MISPVASLRINLQRFPLIMGVVFVHACDPVLPQAWQATGPERIAVVNNWIQDFISQGLARTAVPAFFMLSSYLFFAGLDASHYPHL